MGIWCNRLRWTLVFVVTISLAADEPVPPAAQAAVQRFQQGPAVFIENRGQWEAAEILFALDSQGANVGLTVDGPRFQLFRREPAPGAAGKAVRRPRRPAGPDADATPELPTVTRMHPFAVHFLDARPMTPTGERPSERLFHYRRGAPSRWRENVPAWETVLYRGLYDGIDLRVLGRRSAIKYEFLVAPGARWQTIQLRYEGIRKLEMNPDGSLLIQVAEGWEPLRDAAPVVYQEFAGQRRPIAAAWHLVDTLTAAFDLTGEVDPAHPLVIDPCWAWPRLPPRRDFLVATGAKKSRPGHPCADSNLLTRSPSHDGAHPRP